LGRLQQRRIKADGLSLKSPSHAVNNFFTPKDGSGHILSTKEQDYASDSCIGAHVGS
jgi:hypothetical protein